MGQCGTLLPHGSIIDREVHSITILVCIQHLPEMVIGITEAHAHARLSNIVNVEVGESGRNYSHTNHGAIGVRNDGYVENQRELTY